MRSRAKRRSKGLEEQALWRVPRGEGASQRSEKRTEGVSALPTTERSVRSSEVSRPLMPFLFHLEHPSRQRWIDVWIPVVSGRTRVSTHRGYTPLLTRIGVSGCRHWSRVFAGEGSVGGYRSRSDVSPCIRSASQGVWTCPNGCIRTRIHPGSDPLRARHRPSRRPVLLLLDREHSWFPVWPLC